MKDVTFEVTNLPPVPARLPDGYIHVDREDEIPLLRGDLNAEALVPGWVYSWYIDTYCYKVLIQNSAHTEDYQQYHYQFVGRFKLEDLSKLALK